MTLDEKLAAAMSDVIKDVVRTVTDGVSKHDGFLIMLTPDTLLAALMTALRKHGLVVNEWDEPATGR